jgi:hypothetical protein
MDTLVQPRLMVIVWTMAAFAWVLTQVVPLGLKLLSDYRVGVRRTALQQRRETLVADWGLDER